MKSKQFWIGILLGAILTMVFWSSLVTHISQPLGTEHGDAYRDYFYLKHYVTVAKTGNWGKLTTPPFFYGFRDTLFFNDHFLVLGALAVLLQPITSNVIASFHVLSLITVFLSFVSMYLLVWYRTKKVFPGVIAGTIYAFNGLVTGRFPDHIEIYAMEWIPLILLAFEVWLTKPTSKWGMIFCLLLTTQLMASSLYDSVMLSVLFPVYALIRWKQVRPSFRSFLTPWTLVGLIGFLAVLGANIYVYLLPYKLSMAPRTMDEIQLFSPYVTDYLFSGPHNLVYGALKPIAASMFPSFIRTGIPSEHNLFFGVIPWVLLVISWFTVRKSKDRYIWYALIGIFIISIMLSFGPLIHISDTISIHGPYALLYWLDPAVRFLRVPARFALFAVLSIASIAGLTAATWDRKKWGVWVHSILLIGILVECWMSPLQFLSPKPDLAVLYKAISSHPEIHVVLEWPLANDFPVYMHETRAEEQDAGYLLYATLYHDKVLFDGYAGTYPLLYWQRTQFLTMNFPSSETIRLLRVWGIDAIVVHRDEYADPADYNAITHKLQSIGIRELSQSSSAEAFDITTLPPGR